MPRKPKKPCRYPGYPNLTESAYCEEHSYLYRQSVPEHQREVVTDAGGKPGAGI